MKLIREQVTVVGIFETALKGRTRRGTRDDVNGCVQLRSGLVTAMSCREFFCALRQAVRSLANIYRPFSRGKNGSGLVRDCDATRNGDIRSLSMPRPLARDRASGGLIYRSYRSRVKFPAALIRPQGTLPPADSPSRT